MDPAAQGLIPGVLKIFSSEKTVDIAKVNQQRSLEESGQWLENVYPSHLVLTRGKLVLKKW